MNPKQAIALIRKTKGPLYVWTQLVAGDDGSYIEAIKADVVHQLMYMHADSEVQIRVGDRDGLVYIN